jgi:hypothetical protein
MIFDVLESFSSHYRRVMPILKAVGSSVAVIRFDTASFGALRRDQVDHAVYHIARLLAGESTAESEWAHLGMTIVVRPDDGGGLKWVRTQMGKGERRRRS